MVDAVAYQEHRISTAAGGLYCRDYPGEGPAFVLMHGFPDNLHIYDHLVPLLTAARRRVVSFDFLGFGRSEKPPGAVYSFAQQRADLEAVIEQLHLGPAIPVSHDAAGPAALNFALAHPERTAAVVVINSAYAKLPSAAWPELITLFATPALRAYSAMLIRSPEAFRTLITFQRDRFRSALAERHRDRYDQFLTPLMDDNFAAGSGQAFVQMTADFFAELRRNREFLPRLGSLQVPVSLIWGEADPYLGVALARELAGYIRSATLQLLPGGHWVQVDEPEAVAAAMLAVGLAPDRKKKKARSDHA